MFQVNITFVFEVFACCPPGPPLPEKRQRSSLAGIVSHRVTTRSPVTSAIGQAPRAHGMVCWSLRGTQRASAASIAAATSGELGSIGGRKRTMD